MTPAFEATASSYTEPAAPAPALRGRALAAAVAAPLLVITGAGLIAGWLAFGLPGLEAALLQGVALVACAAWVARRDDLQARRPQEPWLDRSTGLFNREGLFAATNAVLATQGSSQDTSVIVLEFTELREVYDIYGPAVARKLVARMVRKLQSVAGARGLVGRTGTSQFTITMPGVREEKALRALQRAMGKPARVEFDAGDSEIVLVPEVLLETAEPGAGQVRETWRTACRELARRQRDELRRQSWLARERERHSRPMSLPSQP